MAKRIEDYAMIGDGQSLALVGLNGAIDWLCLPRFDSDACFAALLGRPEHGSWELCPQRPVQQARRRYAGDTLVLETEFHTEGGACLVTDFMPIREGKHSSLVRIVSGLSGVVEMRTTLRARFDYGRVAPWYSREEGVLVGRIGPDLLAVRADIPLREEAGTIAAAFPLVAGQQVVFCMQHGESTAALPPALDAHALLRQTKRWWLDWISGFKHETAWPDLVRRSLITLKALTYMPTGGILAAGTAGLPEKPGGRMNWDYRYCWLRDSAFTLTAFLNAGFEGEAKAWLQWLLRTIGNSPEHIRIAYRVDGGRHMQEWWAKWLPGFEGALPVRIGNQAAGQRQLDIFGEIIDSSHLAEQAGLDRNGWEMEIEQRLVEHVEKTWRTPDQGFWESRGRPRHYVYSKVMAWVAVDRFLKLKGSAAQSDPALRTRLERLRATMHAEICARGVAPKSGHFTAYYGTRRVQAELLLLPLVGFLPVEDPRISATIAEIERVLVQGGLVRRKRAPLFGGEEGCFIACACWLASCMGMQNRHQDAQAMMQRVADIANDVGLLAEEYHIPRQALYGNYPQALSHLAFINAALGLRGATYQRGGG